MVSRREAQQQKYILLHIHNQHSTYNLVNCETGKSKKRQLNQSEQGKRAEGETHKVSKQKYKQSNE